MSKKPHEATGMDQARADQPGATLDHGDPAHPNHPDALDAAASQAEAESDGVPMGEYEADPETGEVKATRVRRAFTMKMFLPAEDWIDENVLGKPKGTKVLVGRVSGFVSGFEDRTNTITKSINGQKFQQEVKSIALTGRFHTEAMHGDQERGSYSLLFLPLAFAEQAKAALLGEPGTQLRMDVDIGLEKTGKAIPYEWTVFTYIQGKQEQALRQIVNSRRPGQPPRLAAPPAQQLIEGTSQAAD